MCVPPAAMAIASFALGAGSSIMNYNAQKQQAAAQNQMKAQNDQNALSAMRDSYSSIQNKAIQEKESATEEVTQGAIEGAQARATVSASSGEAGVSGLSIASLLADYYGQEGRYNTSVATNNSNTQNYLRGELDASKANTQSRINSVAYAQKPSLLGALLGIGSAGLNSMPSYNNATQRRS